MRLFVAIKLDDALCHGLARVQAEFQDACARASVSPRTLKWVQSQSIHLTMRFLGNVDAERIPALEDAIRRATPGIAPFKLTARGLGSFPNPNRPNNIWVGLDGDTRTAALLARNLEQELVGLGFAPDRRGFEPHLTLGRVRQEASAMERARIGEILKNFPTTSFGTIHADAVHLIASELKSSGPVYTTLALIMLGN